MHSVTNMIKNLSTMPPLLQLLTASTLTVPALVMYSVVPGVSITILDQQVSLSQWWTSGAGLILLIVGFLTVFSAVLMLLRSRYGRPAYIVSWIIINLSGGCVVNLLGIKSANLTPIVAGNLALTIIIALYLYKNAAVKNYFHIT